MPERIAVKVAIEVTSGNSAGKVDSATTISLADRSVPEHFAPPNARDRDTSRWTMDQGKSMDWSLETKTENGILVATIVGTLDQYAYLSARDKVLSLFKESAGTHHILFDIRRAVLNISTMGVFEVAASSPVVLPPMTRYAVVYSSKTLPEEDCHFGENVAANRGALLKSFTDIAEAKQWLIGEPNKATGSDEK